MAVLGSRVPEEREALRLERRARAERFAAANRRSRNREALRGLCTVACCLFVLASVALSARQEEQRQGDIDAPTFVFTTLFVAVTFGGALVALVQTHRGWRYWTRAIEDALAMGRDPEPEFLEEPAPDGPATYRTRTGVRR